MKPNHYIYPHILGMVFKQFKIFYTGIWMLADVSTRFLLLQTLCHIVCFNSRVITTKFRIKYILCWKIVFEYWRSQTALNIRRLIAHINHECVSHYVINFTVPSSKDRINIKLWIFQFCGIKTYDFDAINLNNIEAYQIQMTI